MQYHVSITSLPIYCTPHQEDKPEKKGTHLAQIGPTQRIRPLPVVSAIVVFHEGDHLKSCLEALRKAARKVEDPVEIIVVENGARSDLWSETSELWDSWADLAKNEGPSSARNIGAQLARAELLAFVDDDGQVAPDFFQAALPYFKDPRVLGIRGRVIPRNHPYFSTLASHYDRGNRAIEDALITEGASLIRRTPFLEVKGFPEELQGHEGLALTHKLAQYDEMGRTLYAPDVHLYHDYLETWSDFLEKSLRLARNEQEIQNDTALHQYLQDYFETTFPMPDLSLRQRIARQALRAIRGGIQGAVRKTSTSGLARLSLLSKNTPMESPELWR